ncbi:MAG TPA: AtpZ/AtpI family protein [Gemmatimonadaceae bacterium]|nr:AtpZ/AtpI family protein [Gemmatimonadaceae bacterium]
MPRNSGTEPDQADDELNLTTYAGAGLQFAVAIILFLFIGNWADRKLGTAPVFLLTGVFIGGGAAFYSMYRRLAAAQKADDERRKRKQEPGT